MQIRAMLKAAGGRDVRIMFPMIANIAEFEAAKAIAHRELAHLQRHGHMPPTDVQLGAMVEVPSLLWELDSIAARADFLSVGSNDLVQYMYAADRDNTRVSKRYDTLSTPVLRALERIAAAGKRAGKTVTLCGEMGGRPLEALALLALGYRSLSMSPSSVGPVKAMILAVNLDEAEVFLASLLAREDGAPSLRETLREFAAARDIPV
jgi:phosphotransferase system enzyme I (PtsP)